MAKIILTPAEPYEGPMTFPPPAGVTLNNTNSSTSVPPHPPVLCTGTLADGVEDSWLEYVPEELPCGKKPPLIISCHGGGASAEVQFAETTWWSICEAEGAVAVFPNAGGETRAWITGSMPEAGEPRGRMDVIAKSPDGRVSEDNHHLKFVRALIKEMVRKYGIDESRVYMQGMSMGDIMTMMFSRVCGDLLAAADCTAGPTPPAALFREDGSLKGYKCPVPMYQSRGDLDNIVPGGNGEITRQDANAANREFWLRVNECDPLPRIAIIGVNNFAFYSGKKANVVFRDVKYRGHGQTLDDAHWAWETLFRYCRRNPDGTVTCADSPFSAYGDEGAAAVAEGGAFAYVNNKRIRLEAPVFSEALTNFNFDTHETEEVKRDLYVPVSALAQIFGGSVEPVQNGKGAVILTDEGLECEVTAESVACLQGGFMRAMFMPAKLKDGVLFVPLRWFAEEVYGKHVTEYDGALYLSDHHGEMSKDMAYLLKSLLAG